MNVQWEFTCHEAASENPRIPSGTTHELCRVRRGLREQRISSQRPVIVRRVQLLDIVINVPDFALATR
jgi:hypothetical protein